MTLGLIIKHPDYLHSQGICKNVWHPQNPDIVGVDPNASYLRYSGLKSGSDSLFPDRFPGFFEMSVPANKKYRFKRLFLEKNGINRDLSLHF